MVRNFNYFFSDGYNRLTIGDAKRCRADLTTEVFNGSGSYFSTLLSRGIRNISKPRYDAITAIFARYGIDESQVWRVAELDEEG